VIERREPISPRETATLVGILAIAIALRLWGLDQNGWGAEYYSAAVCSMAMNLHNFFYAAFDPAGFIPVDKPPIALWVQVAAVKLFDFQPLSLLVPQVLEGVASVWVLYRIVRRRFGAAVALLAAFFLSIMPIAVAVNRTNNMDSALLLVLLLAAWALMKAAEDGNRKMLWLAMALLGVAFNVKMLAAFIPLPVFVLVYFACAPQRWQRRVGDLLIAAVVLIATAIPWLVAYDLTPADARPFVGSSARNSMFDLLLGHNALGRFVSRSKKPPAVQQSSENATADTQAVANSADGQNGPRSVASRLFVRTPTGPLRLFTGQLAAQAAWLLPFAILALALAASGLRRAWPPKPAQVALLFWCGWLAVYGLVYSYAGGIMHYYYLSAMAPAVAVLSAIGVIGLWERYRRRDSTSFGLLLPGTLVVTMLWQFYIQASALGWTPGVILEQSGDWRGWLHFALIAGVLCACVGLLALRGRNTRPHAVDRLAAGCLGLGLASLLVVPMAWTMSSVLVAGHGVLPSADLYRLDPAVLEANPRVRGRFGETPDFSKLLVFLHGNRNGETFLLATSTTQVAAPIIIQTSESVMARGGFHGLDPVLTPESFANRVSTRQVRFAMVGDVAAVSRRMGADAAGQPITDWILAHGKRVDPKEWRTSRRGSGSELYDLRPE